MCLPNADPGSILFLSGKTWWSFVKDGHMEWWRLREDGEDCVFRSLQERIGLQEVEGKGSPLFVKAVSCIWGKFIY